MPSYNRIISRNENVIYFYIYPLNNESVSFKDIFYLYINIFLGYKVKVHFKNKMLVVPLACFLLLQSSMEDMLR